MDPDGRHTAGVPDDELGWRYFRDARYVLRWHGQQPGIHGYGFRYAEQADGDFAEPEHCRESGASDLLYDDHARGSYVERGL